MKMTFLGAAHEVTGSCTYLEVGDKKGLVDYGMQQGRDLFENEPIPVPPAELDFVLLTHAHIDHAGLLPLLWKQGFRGSVYTSSATVQLCDIMLRDSANIQQQEAEWKNRRAQRSGAEIVEPLYDLEDVDGIMSRMIPMPLRQDRAGQRLRVHPPDRRGPSARLRRHRGLAAGKR